MSELAYHYDVKGGVAYMKSRVDTKKHLQYKEHSFVQ